jgi:hypothetical protein
VMQNKRLTLRRHHIRIALNVREYPTSRSTGRRSWRRRWRLSSVI